MARTLLPRPPRAAIAAAALALVLVRARLARPDRRRSRSAALAGLALCRGGGDGAPTISRCPCRAAPALAALARFSRCWRCRSLPARRRLLALFAALLSLWRAGVRRRPRRAAAVARRRRPAGLGLRRRVPRRLWRGAGAAGTAVHLRRLSRRGGGTPPAGLAGGARRAGRDLSAGHAGADRPRCRSGTRCARDAPRKPRWRGINAAVVGLLAAALYNPAFVERGAGPARFRRRGGGFALLVVWRAPPLVVAALAAAAGVALAAR